MAETGEIDTKKQKRIHIYEDTHVEWKIPEFPSASEYNDSNVYNSPPFSFEGESYFVSLYSRNHGHPESASLYLNRVKFLRFSVKYKFGLKKLDGSVEHLEDGIMDENKRSTAPAYVVMSEILQRESELLPNNVLTVTCTLKSNTIHSTRTAEAATQMDKPEGLKLIRLDTLSENFRNLFSDKQTCDITLKVMGKEYNAHRSVLMARSSVFAATFKHDMLERQTGVITISDCDPDSFQQFLDYLYSGKLEDLSFCSALNLYYTSDKYNVQELKAFCVEYLIENFAVENICENVVFAANYDDMQLLSAIQDFFNKNVRKILESSEWECLMKKDYRLASKLLKDMAKVKFED